jgi:beta-lactam-binding protein with PASTA domain
VNKLIVFAAGAVGAIAMSLTLISAASGSPDTSGQTFAEAKAALTAAGYTVVVSTTVGDKLAQGDCTVIRQQDATGHPFLGGGWIGAPSSKPTVRLVLNCSPTK